MDFALDIGIEWKTIYGEIINKLAENGYLGKSLYYYIIAGFFEAVANEYFNINLSKVTYSRPESLGQTKIEFLDGNEIVVSKDFFTDYQIYNDLTRAVTVDDFLSNIRMEVKKILCNQSRFI